MKGTKRTWPTESTWYGQMGLERQKSQTQGLNGSVAVFLCMCCGCGVFVGIQKIVTDVSLKLLPVPESPFLFSCPIML